MVCRSPSNPVHYYIFSVNNCVLLVSGRPYSMISRKTGSPDASMTTDNSAGDHPAYLRLHPSEWGDMVLRYAVLEACLFRWKIIRRIVCTTVAIDPMRWH